MPDQALSDLPRWFGWGAPLFQIAQAILIASIGTGLSAAFVFRALRGQDQAPWHVRARLAYPSRSAVNSGALLGPIGLGVLAAVMTGPACALPGLVLGLAVAAVGYVASSPVRRAVEQRAVLRPVAWPSWIREEIGFVTLRLGVLVVIAAGSMCVSDRFDTRTCVVLGCVAVAIGSMHLGSALWLLRLLGVARPAPTSIRNAVVRAAERLGAAAPLVFVVEFPWANAFAFPLAGCMLFTTRAADALTDGELSAIAGHELGHLGEPKVAGVARMAPGIAFTAIPAIIPIQSTWGVPGLSIALLLVLLTILLARRLARRLELKADQSAKSVEPSGGEYARGLEHLYRMNLVPVVLAGKQVHAHLYDRLVNAGMQPDYARPKPPSRAQMFVCLLTSSLVSLGLAGMIWYGLEQGSLALHRDGNHRAAMMLDAIRGDPGVDIAGDVGVLPVP